MASFEFNEPAILGEELLMIREQVRRFVDQKVIPVADQWEIDGRVPREVLRELGREQPCSNPSASAVMYTALTGPPGSQGWAKRVIAACIPMSIARRWRPRWQRSDRVEQAVPDCSDPVKVSADRRLRRSCRPELSLSWRLKDWPIRRRSTAERRCVEEEAG